MPAKIITPEQFGPELRARFKRDRARLVIAARDAAARGEAAAVRETDAQGLVHLGHYKLAWRARPLHNGAELRNDVPYAGVIEYGRRPGRPGPPLAPILEWVERKLVANGEVEMGDAEWVARLIRNHIHIHGTPPRFVLRTVYQLIRKRYLPDAVRRLVTRRSRGTA